MIDLTVNGHTPPPEGFLSEEEREGCLVPAMMKRAWAVQVDLAQELVRVCSKHGLRVFADSGTLLGAVRHKGFIPWDDDLDMVMFRDDYDRLCSVAAQEFREPYFWQTTYTDVHYSCRHAQLRYHGTTCVQGVGRPAPRCSGGVFIDVFVLDGYPRNARLATHYMRRETWARQRRKAVIKLLDRLPEGLYQSLRRRGGWLSDVGQSRRYDDVLRSVGADDSFLVHEVSFRRSEPLHLRSDYDETVMLPFEYVTLPAPAGYDRVLTRQYGDYMTPVKGGAAHRELSFVIDADIRITP